MTTNEGSGDTDNIDGLTKLPYWSIYGVKRFPYRGRRRYTPIVYQTLDGTVIVSNDVFGLTILQFERTFQACLSRRKQQQERILNLRYPDKTDPHYLDYLKYNDHEGYTDISQEKERHLYRDLTKIVGTEVDIRTRQRMFMVQDKLHTKCLLYLIHLSNGSLAEGVDLPGSDTDVLHVDNYVIVVEDDNPFTNQLPANIQPIRMINDNDNPGYVKLKLISEREKYVFLQSISCRETANGTFLSTNLWLKNAVSMVSNVNPSTHGPCYGDKDQTVDIAACFKTIKWPSQAIKWLFRHRSGNWPSGSLTYEIAIQGCYIVATGPKESTENDLLWRISFSVAEKKLFHSMNYTQLLCYSLLKLVNKLFISRYEGVTEDQICSYYLKTALLYVSEEINTEFFRPENLYRCFILCVDKLISWVQTCYCPNYFIPENNMFRGKINHHNNESVLYILKIIRGADINFIREIITESNTFYISMPSCVLSKMDFFFFKLSQFYVISDDKEGKNLLTYLNSLIKSEPTEFVKSFMQFYKAMVNQQLAQMLTIGTNMNNRGRYRVQKQLIEGTRSDAVSGWILYASFLYRLCQYENTLHIIDHVLSRCTNDMVILGMNDYITDEMKLYHHNLGKTSFTLYNRLKLRTLQNVKYGLSSTLIPNELQLEVQDCYFYVPPVVMSYCLQFLCHHHLGDISNSQQAISDLHCTIQERYFVPDSHLSDSLVILGVCYETSGNKDTALRNYEEASQCDSMKCSSVRKRLAFSQRT